MAVFWRVVGPTCLIATFAFFMVMAAMFLTGCTTKQQIAATPPPSQQQQVTPPPTPRPPGITPGSVLDFRVNVGDTVHFAFNEYNIQDQDKDTLQKQATWLNKYPSVKIIIEGHCDERGTREYNLALGARRANAVKEYLVSLGVSNGRLQTVSYGKERPICMASNENCWAQNRRGVSSITSGGVSS